MEFEKSKMEKVLDFGKFQLFRSKLLGKLLFRTAKLENERRRLLQQIGQYYCDLFDNARDQFTPPAELAPLFTRHKDIKNQLQAHYTEIDQQPKDPPSSTPGGGSSGHT